MAKKHESIPAPASPTNGRLTVLIVDDIVENLELLQDILKEYGFETATATTGQEAVDFLTRAQAHVIISDAMMPKMDGFELCKSVKKNAGTATIPFIIYTGDYVDDEDEELANSIGVDRYVEKTSGVDALILAIKEVVRDRYGIEPGGSSSESSRLDDQEFLERHHAIVVKKLEQKMNELEVFAQTLTRKNRELQISESRYRTLFEQASVAIYILQRSNYKVLDANKNGLDLLGYSREELIALECFPFAAPKPDLLGSLGTRRAYFGETILARSDGTKLHAEISAGLFEYGEESKILLFARDITEQKKIREILIQAEKLSLMGTLASGIAHEIRNPLAAVTLNLQFLEQTLTPGSSDHGAVLTAIEGAHQIDKVIDNTLGLARMTPPNPKDEHINDILKQALGYLKLVIQQKGIHIETRLGEDLPCVRVDSRQIQQVLINLLQNAIEATPAGNAITIKTYLIEETLHLAGDSTGVRQMVLSIRDTGVGIPADRMNELFEPFKTTKSGGTGLGLALSKRILDRHNAGIHIEPAEGGGTLVRLMFPVHSEQER